MLAMGIERVDRMAGRRIIGQHRHQSAGVEIIDNLELSLWCKNCTDEVYDSEYGPQEKELFGGAAKDVAYQARLRTYGLRATYKF